MHRPATSPPAVRAAVVAAGLLLLAACGQQTAPERTAALPPPAVEQGLVHVHGLGVDPADGTLYAATHTGLFAVADDGTAERVANREQDTMGFTVVGPGRFLGSGHPDPREQDLSPPLLGLVESTDAGQSWRSLSLRGQADFHVLSAVHDRVYGYDSTGAAFVVSPDGESWELRSQLPLRDFAVDPADPEGVVAVGETGLLRSTDGGRTWAALADPVPAVVLDWSREAGLVVIGPDGEVSVSTDGGRTWRRTGSVGGAPEAVTLDGGSLHVAVQDRGIVRSDDGGTTFTLRYAAPPPRG